MCLDLYADDGMVVGYPRLMWAFVAYDLPVGTKGERKAATGFHKAVESLGFERFQFSLYNRFCGSQAATETAIRQVAGAVPKGGKVAIFTMTDKQFARMVLYENRRKKSQRGQPDQLLLL